MLSGEPTIYGIDPFNESSDPLHTVGSKGVSTDGRVYRYTKNAGTALATARLCVQADITANHEDRAFASAGSVGDTTVSISIGATNISANEYDNGYLTIIDDTGEGHVHKIVRHGTNTGAANVNFVISPGLEEATTTNTTVTLVRNPYREIVVSDGVQADLPVGVTPIAITANNFFWLQTGGVCSVLTDTLGTTAGGEVTIGDTDNGAVETRNAATEPPVGYAPAGVGGTAGENNPVVLTLDR